MTDAAEPALPSIAPQKASPSIGPIPRPVRTFYWSVRRELWEHRAVYIAPATIAALALVGFLYSAYGLPHAVRLAGTVVGAKKVGVLMLPYAFVAFAVVFTGLLVALFYSAGALHNERRDRSILFWKSLPVSDLTTVLSKAVVPIVILPAVIFLTVVAAQLIMLAASTLVILANGIDPWTLWSHLKLWSLWRMLAQGVPYIGLWYAPVFAWLILVSAWARRMPVLWAVAPPLALGLVERLALGSHEVWSWLALRMTGAFRGAFSAEHGEAPHDLDPLGWGGPHLWIGLVLAAVFFAAAVRLRRSRDPI